MTPRPYFPLLGSKWNSVKHYPRPRCARIVEPFAGPAGYALRYYRSDVVLCERDPLIAGLWRWLIQARPADVLRLPDVQPAAMTLAAIPRVRGVEALPEEDDRG